MASVEKLWPDSTIVCIASGPSLTRADVEFVRGKARVIVINNSHEIAPWADVLWATDARWWNYHKGVPSFTGLKFSLRVPGMFYPPGVTVLANTGDMGIEDDPSGVRNGKNGGAAAINLAMHLGATRIRLLGYDCQFGPDGEHHWHGRHPSSVQIGMGFALWIRHFEAMVQPLRQRGIDVVNCSRRTALTCFPQMAIDEALTIEAAA